MGVKCKYCETDNGITQYFGKVCKRCGKLLMDKEDWNKTLGLNKQDKLQN